MKEQEHIHEGLAQAAFDYDKAPGHWLLARVGRRVLRPGGRELTEKLVAALNIADEIDVHFPSSPTSSIYVFVKRDEGTYWRSDYRYFDQYTLEEISAPHLWGKFEEATAADKLLRMNYDIHVGAILGLPGKILAFFASLIVASLPITGFLIWLKRREVKKAYRSGLQSQSTRTEQVDLPIPGTQTLPSSAQSTMAPND
jgi:uncharacterized iron-regulated membrane protein